MLRIAARIGPDWLERPDDLVLLKQLGIDFVDMTIDAFAGYRNNDRRLSGDDVARTVGILESAGLRMERCQVTHDDLRNAFMGRAGGQREIDDLVANTAVLGEFDIPVLGIQVFHARQVVSWDDTLSWPEGRGGSTHLRQDLNAALDSPLRPDAPTREQLWEGTLNVYRQVLPAAEESGVLVATHGVDPPVPSVHGAPQILHNFADFDRLFDELPSPNNGFTYCVGTRYESGEDVLAGIRKYGSQGRLFHVHFRNVVGTIPDGGVYDEVAPDEGDMDMFKIAQALDEVGYKGVLDYDHPNAVNLIGDGPQHKIYVAYLVGYNRAISQAVTSAAGQDARPE
ncbi:MAG: mannonate dehydratase [Alphaproteobacteria bacterium]|nr:mannonate dehydratase [Alphaproteobacteria bacterium]